MNKVEFDNWVQTMWDKRYNDPKVNDLYVDGRGIILIYNRRNQKVGVARCHPKDKFNRYIGVAIAYARCKGYKVPEISQ